VWNTLTGKPGIAEARETSMTDARSKSVPRPAARSRRWTSFVAATQGKGRAIRGLQEEGNAAHRVRVEHDRHTLLVHLSNEDGRGWTTLAIDRKTREWSIAQRKSQGEAASAAYGLLYGSAGH
jgi:hypothetical protein